MDKKEKERNAISKYISDHGITVISEDQFNKQGHTTDVSKNEFVKFDRNGVYLQIVRQGCGSELVDGVMSKVYGATVPAGWLVPMPYIKVGHPTSENEMCSKVRLIVPHTQGHAYSSSNVIPYYYEITYEREV